MLETTAENAAKAYRTQKRGLLAVMGAMAITLATGEIADLLIEEKPVWCQGAPESAAKHQLHAKTHKGYELSYSFLAANLALSVSAIGFAAFVGGNTPIWDYEEQEVYEETWIRKD